MRFLLGLLLICSSCFAADSRERLTQSAAKRKPEPVLYPKWYPVCLMVDTRSKAKLSAIAKPMSDAFAACGIHLQLMPFYVTGVPTDGEQAQKLVAARCNATTGKHEEVDHASAILVTGDGATARKPCQNSTPDFWSCVQYANPPEESIKGRMIHRAEYSEAAPGQTAVSLVPPNPSKQSVARQALSVLAMSMSGLPRGDDYGVGLGSAGEGHITGGGGDSMAFESEACGLLQAGAYDNSVRQFMHQPDQEFSDSMDNPFDLARPIQLWGRPQNAPPTTASGGGGAASSNVGSYGGSGEPPKVTESVGSPGADRPSRGPIRTGTRTLRPPRIPASPRGSRDFTGKFPGKHKDEEAATPETGVPVE